MAEGTNPASGSEKSPNMPLAQAAGLNEESKNVFTELFGKDASQKSSGLMSTVAAQQDKKTSFFGGKPKQEEPASLKTLKEHPNKPGVALLKASFLLLILTFGVAMSQNSSRFSFFGVNPALKVEQAQDRVDSLTADVNVQNHLEAALLLDQYMSKVDEYFYNLAQSESEYSSENKKVEYEGRVEKLKPELTTLLGNIQQNFSSAISAEALMGAQLVVDALISELHDQKGQVDEQTLLQDIQDLETAKTLLSQTDFKAFVTAINLAKISDEDFENVYDQFSEVNASVTALISQIKSARVAWSTYLDEIETLTKSVDPLFNTEFAGSLTLDEIRFSTTGTVTVTGSTTTDDSKNFTLVSDLIDAYEDSTYFKDVFDRSYTKNGEAETYTGSFRISLTLEK
ncbi:MAG: hypothetical protein WC924_00040 [Candidatus Gracilibacteria bacterium]